MTRNDTFFKILFAIELAIIPLVIFAYHFMEQQWFMGLFIAGIFACRFWMEIFKNKASFQHLLINAIGSVLTLSLILIFFACIKLVNLPLAIVAIVAVVLCNVMKLVMRNKRMPEMIDAVDFCFMVFECLTLLALAFVLKSVLVVNIGLIAITITSAVSLVYKVFYAFKYTDLWINIKKLFRRK